MNNENTVKWAIWIGTGIVSFIFSTSCFASYCIFPLMAANLCVLGAYMARRVRVAKIALLLASVIMFNCSYCLGIWKALYTDKVDAQFQQYQR